MSSSSAALLSKRLRVWMLTSLNFFRLPFNTAKVVSITAMILFCLILHHTVPIYNFHIHLIEKTLSIERYKPWTVAPNKFMSIIFFSTANLKFFPEKYSYRSFSRRCIPKKVQMVSSFLGGKLTTSPVLGTSEITTVKEPSHIANAHLKIIR